MSHVEVCLLDFYKLDSSEDNVNKCLGASVIGSSYGIGNNKITKPNWKPDYDKSKFSFTKKWSHWKSIHKIIFKNIAGLGYEENND